MLSLFASSIRRSSAFAIISFIFIFAIRRFYDAAITLTADAVISIADFHFQRRPIFTFSPLRRRASRRCAIIYDALSIFRY
jgi:hypothetical protein